MLKSSKKYNKPANVHFLSDIEYYFKQITIINILMYASILNLL